MEETINARFKSLEQSLEAIKGEVVPFDGHPDPGAIKDCWANTEDYIEGIKSKSRQLAFFAWTEAMKVSRGESSENWGTFCKTTGLDHFKYLPQDNNNKVWEKGPH